MNRDRKRQRQSQRAKVRYIDIRHALYQPTCGFAGFVVLQPSKGTYLSVADLSMH